MSASRCRFLLESVADLRSRLRDRGSDLIIRCGHPEDVIPDLVEKLGDQSTATTLYAHTDVCSEEIDVHAAVTRALMALTGPPVAVEEVWGNTLHHLGDLPFDFPHGVPDIFTQFRKMVEQKCRIRTPVSTPGTLRPLPSLEDANASVISEVPTVEQLGFEPAPEKDERAVMPFNGGETAGLKRVRQYIWEEDRLRSYKETRNGLLGSEFSSKFSPWLALGCLSPKTIVSEIRKYEKERIANDSTYWLIFELLWRDFFRYSAVKNGNSIFHLGGPRHDAKRQEWRSDVGSFEAWKAGETGYPFIDANMRELKASGFMSNRGRQVVASFFTKDLKMDWRLGAEHFEEHLLDHDPASNWGNWNYVAGVGSDPREDRYFNIEKQAKTYDQEGAYIRHWLPELAALPTTALQTPGGITTMLRHVHNVPVSAYPNPIAPLKFSGARKGGSGRQGSRGSSSGMGSPRDSGGGNRAAKGGRGGKGASQGSGSTSRKFKASRLQRDGGL
ncbi:unnamed protein product [Sphacelaria rigidula]